MADIDKALPNEVRTEIDIPGEEQIAEEVNVEELTPEKGPQRTMGER